MISTLLAFLAVFTLTAVVLWFACVRGIVASLHDPALDTESPCQADRPDAPATPRVRDTVCHDLTSLSVGLVLTLLVLYTLAWEACLWLRVRLTVRAHRCRLTHREQLIIPQPPSATAL
jgi:hypothetical protein